MREVTALSYVPLCGVCVVLSDQMELREHIVRQRGPRGPPLNHRRRPPPPPLQSPLPLPLPSPLLLPPSPLWVAVTEVPGLQTLRGRQ